MRIFELLSHGKENAISRRELAQLTNLDERVVRRMIHEERRQGFPIISDNLTGYYLPADESERRRCVQSLRHRASEILAAAAALESADISGW